MTAERLIKIPPLESGDRLTRDEFERRYRAMPNLKKAELIEGVVYVASPLRAEAHGKPHGDIMGWLWTYKAATPGIELYDNPTVRLDADMNPSLMRYCGSRKGEAPGLMKRTISKVPRN